MYTVLIQSRTGWGADNLQTSRHTLTKDEIMPTIWEEIKQGYFLVSLQIWDEEKLQLMRGEKVQEKLPM